MSSYRRTHYHTYREFLLCVARESEVVGTNQNAPVVYVGAYGKN